MTGHLKGWHRFSLQHHLTGGVKRKAESICPGSADFQHWPNNCTRAIIAWLWRWQSDIPQRRWRKQEIKAWKWRCWCGISIRMVWKLWRNVNISVQNDKEIYAGFTMHVSVYSRTKSRRKVCDLIQNHCVFHSSVSSSCQKNVNCRPEDWMRCVWPLKFLLFSLIPSQTGWTLFLF